MYTYCITYNILISEKENKIDQISSQSVTAYRNRMKPRLLIFTLRVRNQQFFMFLRIFLNVFYNTIL